jgi:hypothetical protein
MKSWLNKNYKTLIITAFLIPIITVAVVSISHVTQWYGISNPLTWAIYLSIGIEIAALSALAAISANMGKKVYFPFAIVTIIQFIGNIYFSYSYINISGDSFKMWVELVSPLLEMMGIEPTDYVSHKRFLSLFVGGMLPIISLSFLHMLVKFTEEDRLKKNEESELKVEPENVIESNDLISEVSKIRLSEEDLRKLEHFLNHPPKPNDNLINAANRYKSLIEEEEDDDIVSDEEVNEIYSTSSLKNVETENIESTIEEPIDTTVNPQITDSVTTSNEINNVEDLEEKKKNQTKSLI